MPSSPEIRTAIRILEEFKKVDHDITLPSMLAFLYAVERDDQSGNQDAITRRLDMSGATASRAMAHWQSFKRPRIPGLNMMDSVPDPEDRRYKMVTLNRRGLIFAERIKLAVMEGSLPES
jgi:DNA-binding MarR family transcriptional regulator